MCLLHSWVVITQHSTSAVFLENDKDELYEDWSKALEAIAPKESSYKVPKGSYIGIDGKENATYYSDASFENAFDFENTQALENIKIYAKNK